MNFVWGFGAGVLASAAGLVGFLYFWEWRIERKGTSRVRDAWVKDGHLKRVGSWWVYSGTNYSAVREYLPRRTRYEERKA